MTSVRQWVIAAAVALAACSGEDTPTEPNTPGPVAFVNIAAVSSSMVVGATQQMTAALYDKDGKAVTSSSVVWSATPTAVATISASGVLTGVTPGTVKVTATSGSQTSTADILVEANPCTTPITMTVGQVRTFTGGAPVSCITLAASSGASDYIVIATNTRPVQDDVLQYSVSLQQAAGVEALPSAVTLAALTSPAVQSQLDPRLVLEQQEALRVDGLHERLRGYERAWVGPVVPSVARTNAMPAEHTQAQRSVALSVQAVGDTITYRVPNLNTGKDICRDYITIKAVVRSLSSRATIVEDVTTPTNGFTSTDYNAIAAEFDNLIYPADTAWFGKPTDINSDGRVTILYTPEVNKLTAAGSAGFTAGFFFGSDLIKKAEYPTTNDCRNQTNEQEIFYVLSPDPLGTYNNVRTTATVRQGTRGVIAHEFQHMINQGVRQYNPAVEALETFWLNEGLSHLAEEFVGRALLGVGDFQRLTYAQVNPTPNSANDYNAFFRQNLVRFQRWMARPDTAAPISIQNRAQLAPRGASWALLRYVIDQYSNGSARTFTKALAAGPQTDVANLLARTPGVQFDQIIAGWLVANYADGVTINGLASKYGYSSWNMRDAMTGSNAGTFPLLVTPLPGTFSGQAMSSSGSYYRLTRTTNSPQVQVKVQAPGGSNLSHEYSTVVVLRGS
ncbi:MAG: Ig-like domain-containing protein [Gemmatimonadaceae bacterium]|nr:Ig-like domain-containing protein [Gemmatimonadaceae bacterium]